MIEVSHGSEGNLSYRTCSSDSNGSMNADGSLRSYRLDLPSSLPASEGPSRAATISNSGGCGEIEPAGKAVLLSAFDGVQELSVSADGSEGLASAGSSEDVSMYTAYDAVGPFAACSKAISGADQQQLPPLPRPPQQPGQQQQRSGNPLTAASLKQAAAAEAAAAANGGAAGSLTRHGSRNTMSVASSPLSALHGTPNGMVLLSPMGTDGSGQLPARATSSSTLSFSSLEVSEAVDDSCGALSEEGLGLVMPGSAFGGSSEAGSSRLDDGQDSLAGAAAAGTADAADAAVLLDEEQQLFGGPCAFEQLMAVEPELLLLEQQQELLIQQQAEATIEASRHSSSGSAFAAPCSAAADEQQQALLDAAADLDLNAGVGMQYLPTEETLPPTALARFRGLSEIQEGDDEELLEDADASAAPAPAGGAQDLDADMLPDAPRHHRTSTSSCSSSLSKDQLPMLGLTVNVPSAAATAAAQMSAASKAAEAAAAAAAAAKARPAQQDGGLHEAPTASEGLRLAAAAHIIPHVDKVSRRCSLLLLAGHTQRAGRQQPATVAAVPLTCCALGWWCFVQYVSSLRASLTQSLTHALPLFAAVLCAVRRSRRVVRTPSSSAAQATALWASATACRRGQRTASTPASTAAPWCSTVLRRSRSVCWQQQQPSTRARLSASLTRAPSCATRSSAPASPGRPPWCWLPCSLAGSCTWPTWATVASRSSGTGACCTRPSPSSTTSTCPTSCPTHSCSQTPTRQTALTGGHSDAGCRRGRLVQGGALFSTPHNCMQASSVAVHADPDQCCACVCPSSCRVVCCPGRYTWQVQEGDVIVAASDGLYDNLWDEELIQLLQQGLLGIQPLQTAASLSRTDSTASLGSTKGGRKLGLRGKHNRSNSTSQLPTLLTSSSSTALPVVAAAAAVAADDTTPEADTQGSHMTRSRSTSYLSSWGAKQLRSWKNKSSGKLQQLAQQHSAAAAIPSVAELQEAQQPLRTMAEVTAADISRAAELVAAAAAAHAADKEFKSPWSVAAGRAYGLLARLFAKGGKMDDITCVVAVVQDVSRVASAQHSTAAPTSQASDTSMAMAAAAGSSDLSPSDDSSIGASLTSEGSGISAAALEELQ